MSSQWHPALQIKSVAGEKSKQIFLIALIQTPFYFQTYCAHSCSKLIRKRKRCVSGSTKSLSWKKRRINFFMLSEETLLNKENLKTCKMKLQHIFGWFSWYIQGQVVSVGAIYVCQCRRSQGSLTPAHTVVKIKRNFSLQQRVDVFLLFPFLYCFHSWAVPLHFHFLVMEILASRESTCIKAYVSNWDTLCNKADFCHYLSAVCMSVLRKQRICKERGRNKSW